jgi:holo-[acyl-carrier protein] synthase
LGIIGIGADLVEISRFSEAGEKYGGRFFRRLFTTKEIAYCESRGRPSEHYAARFAAKEAALKALGLGWSGGVTWVDVEVIRGEQGPPTIKFKGIAKKRAEVLGVRRSFLSLSHSRNLAQASVVLEGD